MSPSAPTDTRVMHAWPARVLSGRPGPDAVEEQARPVDAIRESRRAVDHAGPRRGVSGLEKNEARPRATVSDVMMSVTICKPRTPSGRAL